MASGKLKKAIEETAPQVRGKLTWASQDTPVKTHWLVKPLLRLGVYNHLIAAGGTGKTTFATWLAAGLSRGFFEGEFKGQPVKTLFVTLEDKYQEGTLPRLVANGADPSKVGRYELAEYSTGENSEDETEKCFDFELNYLEELEQAITENGVGLIVIDPIISLMPRGTDMNNALDVRRFIGALENFAEKTGVAILGIAHPRKTGGSSVNRGAGSFSWHAASRAILEAARDEQECLIVSSVKNNNSAGASSWKFRFESVTVPGVDRYGNPCEVETPKLLWLGETETSTDDILGEQNEGVSADEVAEVMEELLQANREMKRADLLKQLKAALGPFSDNTLKRAGKKLKIEKDRKGFGVGTIWRLPPPPPAIQAT